VGAKQNKFARETTFIHANERFIRLIFSRAPRSTTIFNPLKLVELAKKGGA